MTEVPLGEGLVLHDRAQNLVHVLNPSARVLWEACDGDTRPEQLLSALAAVTGNEPDLIAGDIRACLDQFRVKGLVGRADEAVATGSPPPEPVVEGRWRGASFSVLDEVVALTGEDRDLVGVADDLLSTLVTGRDPSILLRVGRDDTGALRLTGRGHDQSFGTVDDLLAALTSRLNRVAAASTTCLGLHCGAVRDPAGRVVLLPGASGAGKSTLTAALVRAGWDYLTDEAVGIRLGSGEVVSYPKPLSLDARSRGLLGLAGPGDLVPAERLRPRSAAPAGPAGSVDRIVLASRHPGPTSRRRLAPEEAVTALAEHCFNLAAVPASGLAQLVRLARGVPCHSVTYPDLASAVSAVT